MAAITVEEWQSILNTAGITDLNGERLVEDDDNGPKTRSALVKMARGGASTGGPHNHDEYYSQKRHAHTATTTIS